MPYMKKRAFRRKPGFRTRRRFFRRRKTPMYRKPSTKIYNFKRTCERDNFQIATGVSPTFKNYLFSLDQLPNYTEFTLLFDRYRIMAVKVTFYPPFNTAYVSATTASSPIFEFYSVVDYDSNAALSSLNQMEQYDTLKRTYFRKPHSRFLRPKPNMKCLYNGNTSTNTGIAVMSNKTWLTSSDPTVVYYGLYVGVAASDQAIVDHHYIRCTATYYIQCKNTH